MTRLRGRVLWAFRAFLLERGTLDAVLRILPKRASSQLQQSELPEWVEFALASDVVTAVHQLGGLRELRQLGEYTVDLLVDPCSAPDPELALRRALGLMESLTEGLQVHFEPLRRVAGRLYIRTASVKQDELLAEVWCAAIQAVLRRNCARAWTLMEDVFQDHTGGTLTVLCNWDHRASTAAA